jgi:hypothetical protein
MASHPRPRSDEKDPPARETVSRGAKTTAELVAGGDFGEAECTDAFTTTVQT